MARIPAHSESIVVGKGTTITGANEFFLLMRNTRYRADGTVPGFVYCGGATAGAANGIGMAPAKELARRGYPGICGDYGDTPTVLGGVGLPSSGGTGGPGVWGNDASLTKFGQHVTYLQGTMGAKAGKIIILYGSGGCSIAYNWARANPSSVYCIAGAIGSVDLEFARSTAASRDTNFQASIEAAYTDNTTWQAARPTHNPIEYVSTLSAIPQLDYYGAIDNTVDDGSAGRHVAFGAAAGAALTQVAMAGVGHGLGGLLGNPLMGDFATWVEQHLT